jgi:predicted ATPase
MATGQAERPVLLERAEELAAVEAAIADVLAGLGRFGVVEGSAGIGKSSLLAEARLRAAAAGMTVLTARGSEIERSFSYGAVRQLFERLIAERSNAALEAAGRRGRSRRSAVLDRAASRSAPRERGRRVRADARALLVDPQPRRGASAADLDRRSPVV